jgi:hypothetical protein
MDRKLQQYKEVRGIYISVGITVPTFIEKVARQLNGKLKFPMQDEE